MSASELDHQLRSFALRSVSCCDECKAKADQAREQRQRADADHHGAPEHVKKSILAKLDEDISRHEKGIMTHARRAAWADDGYMINGPDERNDTDYQRQHGSLLAAMGKEGRVHHFDTYDDGEAEA